MPLRHQGCDVGVNAAEGLGGVAQPSPLLWFVTVGFHAASRSLVGDFPLTRETPSRAGLHREGILAFM